MVRRFIDYFFNLTACMVIIMISHSVILLGLGWVLGDRSSEPDLFTPTLSYFGDIGAILGGSGTIALAMISIKALYSWKEEHLYQHRFGKVVKILDAYDELSVLFDEYLVRVFLNNNNIKTAIRLDESEDDFQDRLKDLKLRWDNSKFDSVFENLEILFSDEEINELRRGSKFAIGLMQSEISKFCCESDANGRQEFMSCYPQPSQLLKKPLDNIKKAVRDMASE